MYSAKQIARQFLEISSPINALKLHMLCYNAHLCHIASTRQPLISDKIEAWTQGPAFLGLCNAIGTCSTREVNLEELPEAEVSEEIRDFLKKVWDKLGSSSGTRLAKDSREKDTPWYRATYPDRTFLQQICGWGPISPEITTIMIRRYCVDYGLY